VSRLVRAGSAVTQGDAQPGQQLVHVERLGDVVVGTGVQGGDLRAAHRHHIVPRLPLTPAVTGLAVAIAVLAAGATLIAIRPGARPGRPPDLDHAAHRVAQAPARSPRRTLGLVVLRCYLLAAIIALAVRAIQLALGAG
jgi:hypothetical protein